jgi:hypothetical protein
VVLAAAVVAHQLLQTAAQVALVATQPLVVAAAARVCLGLTLALEQTAATVTF